jgi:hypothetical protein
MDLSSSVGIRLSHSSCCVLNSLKNESFPFSLLAVHADKDIIKKSKINRNKTASLIRTTTLCA